MSCPDCNHRWKRPQEKMTDVALASGLIVGALRDMYDTALLVCADADLIPAVRVARSEGKRLLVVSPRGRTSDALAKEGDGHLHISTSALGRCQLADPIITATGITLRRPTTWR